MSSVGHFNIYKSKNKNASDPFPSNFKTIITILFLYILNLCCIVCLHVCVHVYWCIQMQINITSFSVCEGAWMYVINNLKLRVFYQYLTSYATFYKFLIVALTVSCIPLQWYIVPLCVCMCVFTLLFVLTGES